MDYLYGADLSLEQISTELFMSKYIPLGETEDLEFSFQLYNKGNKVAYIDSINVEELLNSGNNLNLQADIIPKDNFNIKPGENTKITVKIPAANSNIAKEIRISVVYNGYKKMVNSDFFPVVWGSGMSLRQNIDLLKKSAIKVHNNSNLS